MKRAIGLHATMTRRDEVAAGCGLATFRYAPESDENQQFYEISDLNYKVVKLACKLRLGNSLERMIAANLPWLVGNVKRQRKGKREEYPAARPDLNLDG